MKARVHISLKPEILDPQGQAIGKTLRGLGFAGVGEVRQGKLIELDLAETDPARARTRVEEMCRQLLANPVIENYAIELAPAPCPPAAPGAADPG
jgi:phosphoribosylformylglycinamidine synthase